MKTKPIWNLKASPLHFKSLNHNICTDVVIIGGGITGITTAQLLKDHDLNVVVLEGRKVGEGTTGQSTGNLYYFTEYPLQQLIKKYDFPTVSLIIQSRKEAMQHIQNNVDKLRIDCDLKTQPMFLFETGSEINIEEELKLASKLELPAFALKDENFPLPYEKGLVVQNQAQINPLAYVQGLAKKISDSTCQIFENSCVVDIEEKEGIMHVKTSNNLVKAKYVIHATHTPKGLQIAYHTTLGPYREYGIGVKLSDDHYPHGIFWGHFNDKKYSVRTYGEPNDPYLICVGSMHKVGQQKDNRENIRELEDFVRKHFNVDKITHKWGGQNYKSADMLPYIGRLHSGSKEYIASGFSTDGLVYGTLAAQLISNEILKNKNPYLEIFKASRHQPLKSAKKFTKENINVVGKLLGDFFKKGEDELASQLLIDEGKLLQLEKGKYAVYKNSKSEITILSPICPHMGCTVDWNKAEKTWDCPCHGSRFDPQGKVIEGPAYRGLKHIK